MKLYIQNMVSLRCKMFVKQELIKLGLKFCSLELGEVHLDSNISSDQWHELKCALHKSDEGHDHVNVLIKLDEMKVSHSNTKAFMEDAIWAMRNYKQIGNIAVVAHSKILKALIPIDNFFFERLQKGYHERYFDRSQMDEAMRFIAPAETK